MDISGHRPFDVSGAGPVSWARYDLLANDWIARMLIVKGSAATVTESTNVVARVATASANTSDDTESTPVSKLALAADWGSGESLRFDSTGFDSTGFDSTGFGSFGMGPAAGASDRYTHPDSRAESISTGSSNSGLGFFFDDMNI